MAATYDTEGNYVYPEGFDSETGEWLSGFDKQREEWERQYAEARGRWEAHTKQVQNARAADTEAPAGASAPSSAPAAKPAEQPQGTLATDEALAALKEKLAGGKS
jgi:small subunit ribosomal protein S1